MPFMGGGRGVSYQSLKYRVFLFREFIVDLTPTLSSCKCNISQACLAFYLFLSDVNSAHNVNHRAKSMAVIQDMLGELRSIVRIFVWFLYINNKGNADI